MNYIFRYIVDGNTTHKYVKTDIEMEKIRQELEAERIEYELRKSTIPIEKKFTDDMAGIMLDSQLCLMQYFTQAEPIERYTPHLSKKQSFFRKLLDYLFRFDRQ